MIRFGLTRKVFLALLVVALMQVALLAGVLYWSFQRGFLDYVRRLELERLDPLAAALIAEHAERGDWDWLRHRGRLWHDLVRRTTRPDTRNESPPGVAGREHYGHPPPPPHEGPPRGLYSTAGTPYRARVGGAGGSALAASSPT